MKTRPVIASMIGGLIPLVRAGRDQHPSGESTRWAEITWLRASLRVEVSW